ncbi:MAG: FtsX-like permease family protein [Anaerolineales bacterium]|nr:FtsX-like permease family protein [Anaerolineales bacterium]
MIPSTTFASRPLIKTGWRYLLHNPWQSILMILGITLGVAVVVAIDLANASAEHAFDLSTEAVTGRATHQIVGGPDRVDESLYANLLREGVIDIAAPIVTEYVSSPQLDNNLMRLLGLDPLADQPFRNYFAGNPGQENRSTSLQELTSFLTQPNTILISSEIAAQYDLDPGSNLTLEIGGQIHPVTIVGLLTPADSLSRRALDNLIIADISTAQELTGRIGKLDRIDLILPENIGSQSSINEAAIRASLPISASLQSVEARTGTVEQMTKAFRTNLSALSLLALLVGLFLIYNTMTFSVVSRRPMFGTLRCLGVTRREVFIMVISEAFLIGLLGSILGLILGVLMGQAAIRTVTQTINDLFFVLSVRGIQIPVESLIKGALLGIFATILTSAPPAWEAASVQPRAALSRSGLESKAQRVVLFAAIAGIGLLIAGILTLLYPTRDLVVSFAGTFAVVIGFAMLAPITTIVLMRVIQPPLNRVLGVLGRMAPRDVVHSLSRTSIAIAALMVAVSVTIGVSIMVSSFRHTVILWLEQTLQGDIYISAPSLTATQPSTPIDPAILTTLQGWPGVVEVLTLRSVDVDSPDGPVHIAASSNPRVANERSFLHLNVPAEEVAKEMKEGAVIISEPLANRMNLQSHSTSLSLNTDLGLREFPIAGIYYDYSSTQGTVLMSLDIYRQHWEDQAINAIAINLEPNVDSDQVVIGLKEEMSDKQSLVIRSNQVLRFEVLEVFDRTFAITGALQLLATIVAFIGVLSAFLSLELERQRDFGILRSIGMTMRQLWGLILLETSLMGSIAGLLAAPTGYVLAYILVYIINRRSFGWTLQMQVLPEPFLQALLVAVLAALLAGIYPAIRISNLTEAEAMRYE